MYNVQPTTQLQKRVDKLDIDVKCNKERKNKETYFHICTNEIYKSTDNLRERTSYCIVSR